MERGLTRVVLFMTDDAFHYAGEGQVSAIILHICTHSGILYFLLKISTNFFLSLSLSLPQLAGILKPYRGECLLDPLPSDAGPAGATEFTRWREVVRISQYFAH